MSSVTTGRDAYQRRAWEDAFVALSRASADGGLGAEDVERLAWSATLTGRDDASLAALERLHQLRLDADDGLGAARAAFWLALRLMSLGERARGGGWLVRAQRLVDREGKDCVESGYLRLPHVFRMTAAGDYAAARAAAAEAAEIADRHQDAELQALARNLEGRALIRLGRPADGLPLLDEAMVSVTSGEVSPVVTGIVYCSVIAGCQQSYALERAREWTAVLTSWCEAQPQLVAFAGACLVHRSEILQLGGQWEAAIEEATRASARLVGSRDGEGGHAAYQEGELHRLRGEIEAAERAYSLASELGRDPQPGLALLRLLQGSVDAAAAATRRALLETRDPLQRTRLLPAHIEVMLASSDRVEARRAADELSALAAGFGMEVLVALADQAMGAVTLAEGDALGALEPLRRAGDVWRRLGAPYPAARVRVLVARALGSLGDEDGAALELDGASKAFIALGAKPDLVGLGSLAGKAATPPAHGLIRGRSRCSCWSPRASPTSASPASCSSARRRSIGM